MIAISDNVNGKKEPGYSILDIEMSEALGKVVLTGKHFIKEEENINGQKVIILIGWCRKEFKIFFKSLKMKNI